MRIRPDAVTAHHIRQLSLAENRSLADAARILVGHGVRSRGGNLPGDQHNDDVDDACLGTVTIACHASGAIRTGVQRFAEREERSLSAAMRILLRDALRLHGLLPATNTGSENNQHSIAA